MEVKLKTSEMLLRKLAYGCSDVQLQAVAEIRLFAKWDDANRACLARAGAIPPLIKLLDGHEEARLQENAVLALLNLSINTENKVRILQEEGSVEAVIRLANQAGNDEIKANAASLLYSLIADDAARRSIAGTDESLWATFLDLLREGSAKCKAEALKALFVGAGDSAIREKLLQEDLQVIRLLLSMVTVGKVKLAEDCLAVLALLACSSTGSKAITQASTSISILVYLINSGTSPRVQENAVAVLLNVCQNDREAQKLLPVQVLKPGLKTLRWRGSERGKGKAEALLSLLGIDDASSDSPRHLSYSEIKQDMVPSSMPFLPTARYDSTPCPSNHPVSMSASTPIKAPSGPKLWSRKKYINFARSLFARKPS